MQTLLMRGCHCSNAVSAAIPSCVERAAGVGRRVGRIGGTAIQFAGLWLMVSCSKPSGDPAVENGAKVEEQTAMTVPTPGQGATSAVEVRRLASAGLAQLTHGDSIQDAASDGLGHILLLDVPRSLILVADTALNVTATVSWREQGVTHLWDPVAFGVGNRGRVAVLDRRMRRITELSVSRDGRSLSWGPVTQIVLPSAEWFCPLRSGDYLVYGFRDGLGLHVVDGRTGAVLRSFAPADSKLHSMAQSVVTQGRIACNVSADEVVVSTSFLANIAAYRISSGQRLWSGRLDPFRPIVLVDREKSVTIGSGPAGYSRVTAVFYSGVHIVIQTTVTTKLGKRKSEPDTVVTYVYSRDGTEAVGPTLATPNLISLGPIGTLVVSNGPDATVQLTQIQLRNGANGLSRGSQ